MTDLQTTVSAGNAEISSRYAELHFERDFLTEAIRVSQHVVGSAIYPAIKNADTAVMMIMKGRELGFSPVTSLSAFNVVFGNIELKYQALGALLRLSGVYDYHVEETTNEVSRIRFTRNGKDVGVSVFTIEDAKRAGLIKPGPWIQYPKMMLHARALSSGVNMYCPDATRGVPIYVEGEISGFEPSVTPVVEVSETITALPQAGESEYSALDSAVANFERALTDYGVTLDSKSVAARSLDKAIGLLKNGGTSEKVVYATRYFEEELRKLTSDMSVEPVLSPPDTQLKDKAPVPKPKKHTDIV